MNIQPPNALTLNSDQDILTGFILLSFENELLSGDCVFMLLPATDKVVESDLSIVISELKVSGEHRFELAEKGDGYKLTVIPNGFPELRIDLDREFRGQVYTEISNAIKYIGKAEPAK